MLQITANAKNKMIEDAVQAYPDECCGFIYGTESETERIVEEVLPVFNAKEGDKRKRFEISPKDYLKAERYADEVNMQLLGVYHSHPDHAAKPSETDRLSALPNFSYIILSVLDRKFDHLRSWRLEGAGVNNSHFEEENITGQIPEISL